MKPYTNDLIDNRLATSFHLFVSVQRVCWVFSVVVDFVLLRVKGRTTRLTFFLTTSIPDLGPPHPSPSFSFY